MNSFIITVALKRLIYLVKGFQKTGIFQVLCCSSKSLLLSRILLVESNINLHMKHMIVAEIVQ